MKESERQTQEKDNAMKESEREAVTMWKAVYVCNCVSCVCVCVGACARVCDMVNTVRQRLRLEAVWRLTARETTTEQERKMMN